MSTKPGTGQSVGNENVVVFRFPDVAGEYVTLGTYAQMVKTRDHFAATAEAAIHLGEAYEKEVGIAVKHLVNLAERKDAVGQIASSALKEMRDVRGS